MQAIMKSFHSVGWFLCRSHPISLMDLLVLFAICSSMVLRLAGAHLPDSSKTTNFRHCKKSLLEVKLSVCTAFCVCVNSFLLVTPAKNRSQMLLQIGTFASVTA